MSFDDIMRKRNSLMEECRKEGVATIEHQMRGVYGMLWGVGYESAPGLPQPSTIKELTWAADVLIHRSPSVSRLYDYSKHKDLYKKCYGWIHDLSRVAQGKLSLNDLKW